MNGEERFWIIEKSFTVAAGANDAGSVEIGSFDFRWEALGAEWDDSKGIWSFKVTDNSLNQSFSAYKVSLKAIVGDGKQPYQLPKPAMFGAGGSIYIEVTNSGSATDTLKLTFVGCRLPKQI